MIDDLVPEILKFISKPSHLSSACLVNRTFNRCASRLLYKHIAMYSSQKDVKQMVVLLFATLSRSPTLASFVHRLEIYDFPKYITFHPGLGPNVVTAIENCTNLHKFAWTREGTLDSDALLALSSCPCLRELKLSGSIHYPEMLLEFGELQSISIIMPRSRVVWDLLPTWIALNRNSLTSLALVSAVSSFPTFVILRSF